MTFLGFLMNFITVGLLIATLIYCLRLNKRIAVLQDSKSELARIIKEFDESTQRATQSISDIHAATNRISENIQHKIDKASYLATDLELMIERGGKLSGNPQAASAPARPAAQPQQAAPQARRTLADILPGRSAEAASNAEPAAEGAAPRRPLRARSRAEQDLMNLMGKKNANESNS